MYSYQIFNLLYCILYLNTYKKHGPQKISMPPPLGLKMPLLGAKSVKYPGLGPKESRSDQKVDSLDGTFGSNVILKTCFQKFWA